jgi:hypothetical protein
VLTLIPKYRIRGLQLISQAITPSAHAGATDSSTIETLRAPFRVNPDVKQSQFGPLSTGLTSGGFAVAWMDTSNNAYDVRVQLLGADGS